MATVVNYTADNTTIFRNPERGFTEELGGETMLSDSKNHVIKPDADWYFEETDPDIAERKTQSLLVAIYYLGNYKTKDLSNAILTGFDEDMQILRDKGFKCVLRFAYDWNSKNDAELSWVKKHISQLKPYLEKNSDVIYVLQTGFVGQWGEWYYSSNFGNETQELNSNRRQVLAAMLDACPTNRFLLVRYPLIKLSYLGDEVPLSSSEAFTGTVRARIGHHNDAFLNEWGNDGTYGRNGEGPDDDPILRKYIADETLFVPNGGETNVENSTLAKKVAPYDTTMAELRRYHWSFCGSTYAEQVTKLWRSNGTFDEMDRKLGYRFQLVTATFPEAANVGEKANINIQIKNVGFAPLYNERHAYIVLKNGSKSYSIALQTDPRRWLPNDVVTTINEQITIPTSVPVGTYQLYLHLPDAASSLASDPRFAVRFANADVWDSGTGMNKLNASITIQSSGTPIVTTPTISVANSMSFGNVTVGTPAVQNLVVSGADLEGNIYIASNHSALSVSPSSISASEAPEGVSVAVTLSATAAGSGNATLTLSSINAETKTVAVSWTAAAQGGCDDPTPTPSSGKYSERSYNADSTTCTWNFAGVVKSDATITSEEIDNDIVFKPGDGGKLKVTTSGLSTQKTQNSVYLPVPAGAAGTISATMYGSSDSRWLQLYVNGVAAADSRRLWSKEGAGTDGKKGPQSFAFTAEDITTYNGKTYLTFTDNTTEMKIATFTISLSSGTYAVGGGTTPGGGDPEIPTPSTNAVNLPATLDKANMSVASDDAWWTKDADYYDFGSTDALNTGRYIEWKVNLLYQKEYTVSAVIGFPGDDNADGFTLQLQLLNGTQVVATYTGENTWAEANVTYDTKWNLSTVAKGEYTLRAMNIAEWEQPKLKSITLYTDGTGTLTPIDQIKTAPQVQKILRNGQLLLIKNGKIFTVQGTELL